MCFVNSCVKQPPLQLIPHTFAAADCRERALICTPLCYALILYLAQMFMRPIGSKGHLVFAMCQHGIAASYNLNYIYI